RSARFLLCRPHRRCLSDSVATNTTKPKATTQPSKIAICSIAVSARLTLHVYLCAETWSSSTSEFRHFRLPTQAGSSQATVPNQLHPGPQSQSRSSDRASDLACSQIRQSTADG